MMYIRLCARLCAMRLAIKALFIRRYGGLPTSK